MAQERTTLVVPTVILLACLAGVVALGFLTSGSRKVNDQRGEPVVQTPIQTPTKQPETGSAGGAATASRDPATVGGDAGANVTLGSVDRAVEQPPPAASEEARRASAAAAKVRELAEMLRGGAGAGSDMTALGAKLGAVLPTLTGAELSAPIERAGFAEHGHTLIGLVAMRGDAALVSQLLDAGADVDAASVDGSTPVMLAAGDIGATERGTLHALLSRGPRLMARTATGETALLVAARASNTAAVRDLLEAGADADASNAAGTTPLMLAAQGGLADMVVQLLNAGATPDMADTRGMTARDMAALRGDQAGATIVAILSEANGG